MKNMAKELQVAMHYLGAAEFRKQLREAAMNASDEFENEFKEPSDNTKSHALLAQILDEANETYNGIYS